MSAENRGRLFEVMDEGIAILPAAQVKLRNADTEFDFRQDSSFEWLTGFPEEDAIAVIRKVNGKCSYYLFVNPREPEKELWTGKRYGTKGAKREFAVRHAHTLSEYGLMLEELLKTPGTLYMPVASGWRGETQIHGTLARLKQMRRKPYPLPHQFRDVYELLAPLRLRKTAQEIEGMQRAIGVTEAGLREAMALVSPGVYEYQLRGVLDGVYQIHGASWAFGSIVARGENACTLHYVTCQDRLQANELVLFDTGAEVDGYCADVSRTVPVSGRFNKQQEMVYEIVQAAHQAAIAAARPGVPFDEVHNAAVRVTIDGLKGLGMLRGRDDTLFNKMAHRPWFPHGTSHWLGRDAHDIGGYADNDSMRVLEEGMVLTVEPGLYFGVKDRKVPEALRGIGIRIEDDVLITAEGNRVLSDAIPSKPREIERAMKARSRFFKGASVLTKGTGR